MFRWYDSIYVTLLCFVSVEIERTFWRAEQLLKGRESKEEVKLSGMYSSAVIW